MSKLARRSFLRTSAGWGAITLSAGSSAARADLPVPLATGRIHRDATARRAEKRDEREADGYRLESWVLDLNGLEPVPALLARPKGLRGRAPALLFDHSHGGGYTIGKKEFVEGRSYLQPTPYAKALTAEGWIALCIDHWCFGERAHETELETVKAMLWQGRVLWGMMVYDSIRALDWLAAREDVDPARLGTLGMSMGSTMAQWLAALDERVQAPVDIHCLTEYHTLLAERG